MATRKLSKSNAGKSVAGKSSKIKLTAEALVKLGAKRLGELLYNAAQDDVSLARRLRAELLANDPATLAKEIGRQISSLRRAQSFVDWRRIGDLVKSLDAIRASIANVLAPRDPAGAIEQLSAFFGLAEPTINRCDDSSGRVASVFRDACTTYAEAIAMIEGTQTQFDLTCEALSMADVDEYGVLDHLLSEVVKRLSAEALAKFRKYVEADLATLLQHDERVGVHSSRWRRVGALRAIADAQGDVDLFVAAEMANSSRLRDDAGIARRLVAAGRPSEALKILDAAELTPTKSESALEDARIEALDALGRTDDAQSLRWSAFEAGLRPEPLRGYLKRLPDFEDETREKEALAFVASYRNVISALSFLIEWPAIRRAGELVRARRGELGGDHYWLFTPAADAMSEEEPLAAILLLRSMIAYTLDNARSSRYGHAARHLSDCARLAPRVQDWVGIPDHTAYLASLRAKHPRKVGFWSIVEGQHPYRVPPFGVVATSDE